MVNAEMIAYAQQDLQRIGKNNEVWKPFVNKVVSRRQEEMTNKHHFKI